MPTSAAPAQPVDLAYFVQAMLNEYADSGHWEKRLLLGSVLAVSIGILDRAGITVPARSDAEQAAVTQLRDAAL